MNNSHDTLYLPPDPPDFEMGLSPNLSDYIPTLGNDDSTDDPYDFPYGASDFGGNFMYTHDFKKKKKKLKKRLKRETQAASRKSPPYRRHWKTNVTPESRWKTTTGIGKLF